ncbi:uncharacterized protein LOC119659750 [Hermetia illucens]|uniref:uncharacterized protein LOC119659750 n=1 Tax=Hermetia illucens TaxID=343691 RepID=UPI0018CC3F52|nr:uncharacterized protein LOC119659750 [Hermetia illucens]
MGRLYVESTFTIIYGIILGTTIACFVNMSILWSIWNRSWGDNCFFTTKGSEQILCGYGLFGLLPPVVASSGAMFIHLYYLCMRRAMSEGSVVPMTMRWCTNVEFELFLCGILMIYTFVYICTLIVAFLLACEWHTKMKLMTADCPRSQMLQQYVTCENIYRCVVALSEPKCGSFVNNPDQTKTFAILISVISMQLAALICWVLALIGNIYMKRRQ